MQFSRLIFIVFVFLFSFNLFALKPVWIDYDVAVGKYIRDVDDGFALIHALESDELELKGISTIFGNIKSPKKMIQITNKILSFYGPKKVPVFKGAQGKNNLGKVTPAVRGLIKALENGRITILAMGRLTNVATVLKVRPDLISQIEELLVMGGRQLEQNTGVGKKQVVFWDANIDGDFESMRAILKSRVKLRMIPVESMSKKVVTKKHLRSMISSGHKPLKWLARKSKIWKFIWRIFPNMNGFIPWDLFLVSYMTHPEDFSCLENIPADLLKLKNDTTFNRSGEDGEYKYFLIASTQIKSNFQASYCYSIEEGHISRLVQGWSKQHRD